MSWGHFHAKKDHNSSTRQRSPWAGDVSVHMSPVEGTQLGWTPWAGYPHPEVPGCPSSPHSRGQPRLVNLCCGRPGSLNFPGPRGPSLLGARRAVASIPTLRPGQRPRAKRHCSFTPHLYANCRNPIGLRCPPIPTTLGMLKGLTPRTQPTLWRWHPGAEHHPSSRTTGAKAGPQCAGCRRRSNRRRLAPAVSR